MSFSKFAYGEHLRPTRDWFVIVSVVAGLVVASAAYSYFVFSQAKDVANFTSQGVATTTSTTASTSVAEIFKERERERGNYMSVYRFVDPSR